MSRVQSSTEGRRHLEDLNKLYKQIKEWLPASAQTERTETVFEYWDGHYNAPAMTIRYGDVNLRAVPAGINARSLVYFVVSPEHRDSYLREVHILKEKDEAGWFEVRKVGDSYPKKYPFNREGFLDFLDEMAAYSREPRGREKTKALKMCATAHSFRECFRRRLARGQPSKNFCGVL